MENVLKKYGFIKGEEPNSWVKDNWIVRFDSKLIEYIEDLDKVDNPRYFVDSIKTSDIEGILQYIISENQ